MYNIINIAFPPKRKDFVEYYRSIFHSIREQNITVCRIWLCDFSFNYYCYNGLTYDLNIGQFEQVIAEGFAIGIQFIPVLFDFNEFSSTNINWYDREHVFENSFLSNFLKKPMDFFNPDNMELGLSKFYRLMAIFDKYNNVYAWELFNEVDHVKGFNITSVANWASFYTEAIRKVSHKDIYISFANPSLIKQFERLTQNIDVGVHTYHWPYNNFYKNVIFWQSICPSNWMMEFGDLNMDREDTLIAMISSWILNRNHQVAIPWFWEHVLVLNVFSELDKIKEFLSKYVQNQSSFKFVGSLGKVKQEIGYQRIVDSFKITTILSNFLKIYTQISISLKDVFKSNVDIRFKNEHHLISIERQDFNNHKKQLSKMKSFELINKKIVGNLCICVYSRER